MPTPPPGPPTPKLTLPSPPGYCEFVKADGLGWFLNANHCSPGYKPEEPPNNPAVKPGTVIQFPCS